MSSSVLLVLLLVVALPALLTAAPSLNEHVIKKRSFYDEFLLRADDCQAKKDACEKENYYGNIPAGGYSETAGCKAMKATYKCYKNSLSGCASASDLSQYDQDIKGYEYWCPGL